MKNEIKYTDTKIEERSKNDTDASSAYRIRFKISYNSSGLCRSFLCVIAADYHSKREEKI